MPALVLAAQGFRQMKMPYKPAWMPSAEGRYYLESLFQPPLKMTVTFSPNFGGWSPSLLYSYSTTHNQVGYRRHFDTVITICASSHNMESIALPVICPLFRGLPPLGMVPKGRKKDLES